MKGTILLQLTINNTINQKTINLDRKECFV